MLKEIKILFYIIFIFFFLFFCTRYYISDENKKKSFLSIKSIDDKILINEKSLIILDNNTENIIEFLDELNNEKDNEYKFWELLKRN